MAATSTRTLPYFSNELISRIIDNLRDDSASLKACSLVSQAFLHRARAHRFRTVSLHLKNSQRFLKLLECAPAVGPCVRELQLTVSALEQRSNWVDRLLPMLSKHMPRVEELHMRGKGLYRAAPLTTLQSLRILRICGCEIESLHDYCILLGAFPHLEEQITDEMFVYRCPEVKAKPDVRPKKFRRIEWNSCRVDPIMLVDWMVQEGVGENLEYITCCPVQQIAIAPLAKLFKEMIGESLKRFKLALVGLVAQGGFVEILEQYMMLAPCTGLRIMEFCSPSAYANMYGSDDPSFAWFPTLLSQITGPLETVVFYFWENDAEGLQGAVWNDVVFLLSSRFPTLKRIEVHVWGNVTKTATIRKRVKEIFSEYEERKMLFIDDVADPACT